MKNLSSHSKTSLFLMEMILSILFLSLTACICVQIFIGAKSAREQAREWNHIQEMTVTAGEFLKGSNGTNEEFLAIYPNGILENNTLQYSFDSDWSSISSTEYEPIYYMKLQFSRETTEKKVYLSFYKRNELLYEDEICFPLFASKKEGVVS